MTITSISFDGGVTFYKDGVRHRHEGPVYKSTKGHDFYYMINAKYHRIEGPAVEYDNGKLDYIGYWVNGKNYGGYIFRMKYKPCVLLNGFLS